MSNDSGETYTIEVGITGLTVIGEYSGHKVATRIGYGDIEGVDTNPILDALEVTQLDLKAMFV